MPTGRPLSKEQAEAFWVVADFFRVQGLQRLLGLSQGTIRRALDGGTVSPSSRDTILDWLPKAQRFVSGARRE